MHKTNIYSLGDVLKNATVVRYLSEIFKVLVPAFCRTMERLGNLMFRRKPKEVYTMRFKSNATLTTDVVVFVCSNTNTNTTTSYINKGNSLNKDEIYEETVKDYFRKVGDQGQLCQRSKNDPRYGTPEARQSTHNYWTTRKYKKEYTVIDKPYYLQDKEYEEEVNPIKPLEKNKNTKSTHTPEVYISPTSKTTVQIIAEQLKIKQDLEEESKKATGFRASLIKQLIKGNIFNPTLGDNQ
jgi:hypothetical protein